MKQIFWMSYAYTWCNTEDQDTIEMLILTDVHAPETCRTNLVVQDLPSFGKDFGCRQGVDPMYPTSQDSCVVW
jgi:predicted metalloendopeptidase